jgi:cytochrome c biogenesis protein CcmG, thiol:disulfide interchange protein DsbE
VDHSSRTRLPFFSNPLHISKPILIIVTVLAIVLTGCGSVPVAPYSPEDVALMVEPAVLALEESLPEVSQDLEAPLFDFSEQADETGDLESAFEAFSTKQQPSDIETLPPVEIEPVVGAAAQEQASPAEPFESQSETPAEMGSTAKALAEQPPEKPETGFTAPGFNLSTMEGQQVNIASLRGRPVLINYWASWCSPCLEELPVLEKVSQEFPQLTILSINGIQQDNLDTVRQTVANLGLTHTILLDEGEQFWNSYKVLFLPTSFFIDRHGIIRHVQFGSLTEEKIRQILVQLIG